MKLGDMTLRQINDICQDHPACVDCPALDGFLDDYPCELVRLRKIEGYFDKEVDYHPDPVALASLLSDLQTTLPCYTDECNTACPFWELIGFGSEGCVLNECIYRLKEARI